MILLRHDYGDGYADYHDHGGVGGRFHRCRVDRLLLRLPAPFPELKMAVCIHSIARLP